MKLILITTLKPMSDKLSNFIVEHHNAIQSWIRLDIEKKIIICGNDEGYEQICTKYNLIHEKDIKCTQNVPHIPDMMKTAYGTTLRIEHAVSGLMNFSI